MGDVFPISGNIEAANFPYLLVNLHKQGATGSLKVAGQSYQKALYFRDGRVLFGSSNDPRDQLGSILLEGGRLSPEQLEEASSKIGPGKPLAKLLSDSGFVNQRELGEAARAKVERIITDILCYEEGSFEFEDDVLPKGAIDLKLSTDRVFLAATRKVSDRAFVLRHLAGLDAVLRQAEGEDKRLGALNTECSGLIEQLDGQRTLKEATARTRLDEFEAAKIACGLLFLGLLHKAAPEPGKEPEIVPADGGLELDLGQTARIALEKPLPKVPDVPATDTPFVIDTSAPSEIPAAEPAAETFVLPDTLEPPGPPGATTLPPQSPPPPKPEVVAQVEPPLPPPRTATAPPGPPAPRAQIERPVPPPESSATVTLPPQRPSSLREVEPQVSQPTRQRPSKEDLAALDNLLRSNSSFDGPRPAPRPAPPRSKAWEPDFGQPSAKTRRRPRSSRLPLVLILILGIVVLPAAAGWYFFIGPGAGSRAESGVPPATVAAIRPSPSATPLFVATAAPPLHGPPPQEPLSTPAQPTPVPLPPRATPAPVEPEPTPRGASTLNAARAHLGRGELREAARGYLERLRGLAPGTLSLQILVACADETVHKASAAVQSTSMFIVPVQYRGRSCYRLCWGLYDTREKAEAARRSLPSYFRERGASPKIVPTKSILP